MRSVLITGGAGYIGSHTVDQLRRDGYSSIVVDNLSNGFRESLPEEVSFYQIDVRHKAELLKVFAQHNISAVIHLAGLAIVEESFEKSAEYLDQNVNGTQNVLELCEEFGVKNFIFSSSSTVYGNVNKSQKLTEKHKVSTISPYGKSKLLCEEKIKDLKRSFDLNYLILRYFNVAGASADLSNGPRGKGSDRSVFNAAKAAVNSTKFTVYGQDYPTSDGTCIRDYIHVEDVAGIHVLALKYLLSNGPLNNIQRTLNCGYGEGYSVLQIIENLKQKNNIDLKVEWGPRRRGDPACLVGDNTELVKLLKFKSKFTDPLEAICRSAYQWERKRSL